MIRLLATVLGLLALAVALVGFGARYLPISAHATLVGAAAAPYLAIAAPVAVVLLWRGQTLSARAGRMRGDRSARARVPAPLPSRAGFPRSRPSTCAC